jgi:hypothetical protein
MYNNAMSICMKITYLILGCCIAAILSTSALAVTDFLPVTPAYVREHPKEWSVDVTKGKDELIHFIIKRHVNKRSYHVAHLRVYQQSTLVRKSDTPSIATNGWNTLQFSLSPEDIAESTFELSEHGLGDVGDVPAAGGTDYQFRLSEFVPEKFRKSALVGSAHFAGVVRDDSAKLAANADYTPNDVLDRLNASRKAVSNATFDSVWKTFDDGSKSPDGKTRGSTRWERQTFYWDDLGRRRIMAHGGPVSQDGRMLEEEDPGLSDEYFTGEITVSGGFHPK